jgi:hypothetical protein
VPLYLRGKSGTLEALIEPTGVDNTDPRGAGAKMAAVEAWWSSEPAE